MILGLIRLQEAVIIFDLFETRRDQRDASAGIRGAPHVPGVHVSTFHISASERAEAELIKCWKRHAHRCREVMQRSG